MKNAQAPKKTSGKPKPKALALQIVQQSEPEGRRSFKKYIWSTISSGAALLLGDYLSRGLSQYFTGSEEYNFVFKFLLGATVLGYSASHRIIDKTFSSLAALSAAIGSEVMAISFTYSSVFSGTQFLLGSNKYSLIAGLGTSTIIAPSAIAYLAQKLQVALARRDYGRGAQRSDTATISCGLTPLSTWYFQFYSSIAPELLVSSRAFQLGLIAHNIRYDAKIVRKFRHLPALLADLAPSNLRKLQEQQRKLEFDYEYNNKLYRVLRFTNDGKTEWVFVPSYLLRTDDLVYCDSRVDLNRVLVSGELIALKRDKQGNFIQEIEPRRGFSVNLKAHNGEDEWIEHQSKPDLTSKYPKVDMHAVKNKQQPGVLVGDKLDLRGCDRFFIQIKPEKELLMSHYEKKAVINDLITRRKKTNVAYSILGSVLMAALLKRDLNLIPAETLTLMFTFFQAFIPFSEAFLRDAVNSRLLKKLNADLGDQPFETIDALRVVDFRQVFCGVRDYRKLFPKGIVLLSDKTGTLTLTRMDVLGLWVPEMGADIQKALVSQKGLLLPTEKEWLDAFEVFCSAYTNKQSEREENAILDQFKILLGDSKCLEVLATHSSNHFTKVITGKGVKKVIETFHLGLYSHFGGRFTLVQEGKAYYLVFCGIPKVDGFKDTHVLQDYNKMQTRTGVLSRDWCVARARLNEQEFLGLKKCFDEGSHKKEIQDLIARNTELLQRFSYYGTFIIDNPIKKGAEKFINKCKKVSIPLFVVTGDNTKAAANIAHTLCPENAKKMIPQKGEDLSTYPLEFFNEDHCPADSTIIFSGQKGLTSALLERFQKLMDRKADRRPVIIFAEMSTEGKGLLAQYLGKQGYFVVASGDDHNDTKMMEHSNMVITHPDENGIFGAGVKDLSNISAEQVRRLFRSNKTFYELFDIDELIRIFGPLADSQGRALVTSALKIGPRMSLDMARVLGFQVKEMNHQHWYTMAFDMMWLWISFYEINECADLPMESRNINASRLMNNTMAISLVYGVFQALVNYVLYDESTNLTSMIMMLTFLPLVLKSIFSGFRAVQESLYPQAEVEEVEDKAPMERDSSVYNRRGFFFSAGTKQLEAPQAMPSPP